MKRGRAAREEPKKQLVAFPFAKVAAGFPIVRDACVRQASAKAIANRRALDAFLAWNAPDEPLRVVLVASVDAVNEHNEQLGWERVAPARVLGRSAYWGFKNFTVAFALGQGPVTEETLAVLNGQVRHRSARATLRRNEASGEKAKFLRVKEVQRDLCLYCEAVTALLASEAQPEYVAAWALYHLVRIHPYTEGNGRMARLLAAHLLCLRGLPFYVALGSNGEPRERMQQALYTADMNGDLEPLTAGIEMDVAESCAVFDRTRKAKMGEVMANAAKGIAAAAAAAVPPSPPPPSKPTVPQMLALLKEDRSCCICLDDHADTISLCCGGVAHFWCLKEMCATSTNCPTCRKSLKRLPVVAGVATFGGRSAAPNSQDDLLAAFRESARRDLLRTAPSAGAVACERCGEWPRGAQQRIRVCDDCCNPKKCAVCRAYRHFQNFSIVEWRKGDGLRTCVICCERALQAIVDAQNERVRQERWQREEEEREELRRGYEEQHHLVDRCMICHHPRSREWYSKTQWTSKSPGYRKCIDCT